VTAIGVDDDGQPLQASDDETVTIVAAQRAVIGNRVFIDIDPDGASSAARLAGNQQQDFDAGGNAIEDNVPGMTVLLFTVDHLFVAAVQTDANGFYQFNDVPPGEYYAVFVNPGVFPGAWVGYNVAIADDVNSDVDPSLPLEPSVEALIDDLLGAGASLDAVRTPTFSVAPGQVYLDLDAGLVDLSGANSVDINGIIWLDANRDGIRQQEETIRISGVTVELYKVNDVQRSDVTRIDQIPTDATGFFEFLGLDAGVYFVKMLIPVNYTITVQNVGDDPTIDSDINRATGESERVTVANETVTIDAGVFQTPTALDPIEEPMIMSHQLFLPTVQR
ncbi:MAG: SdrD B-like domain-containing protein, partial [Caldilinea sp.]